ncbi:hypothetical protein LPJ56_005217 [Coemansia sp. RSA 2599]|nr:hypothetical protein LPJ75_005159 [Coemansia sp. RSA 2598]KAJ1813278.1 hypothetical protein LPJ56_005217 [Coemansia sp. RSA 2599]
MFESLTSPAIERLALESVFVAIACQQTHLPPVLPVVELLALEEAVEVTVDEETESMPAQPVVEPLAHQDTEKVIVHRGSGLQSVPPAVELSAPRDKNRVGKCAACTAKNLSHTSSAPTRPATEQRAPRRAAMATKRSAQVTATSKDVVVQRLESKEVVIAAMKPIRLLAVQSKGSCSKSVPEIKKAEPEAPLASSSSTCKNTIPKRLIPEATFVSCSESFSLDSENATLNEQDDRDVVSRSDASVIEPMKKRERFLLKAKQKTAKIRQVASSMSLRKRKSEMTDMNK